MISLEEFLAARQLGGACDAFKTLKPWRRWLTFAKAVNSEKLSPQERKLVLAQTGRASWKARKDGFHEVAAIVGRQAGKTRFAAALVAHAAAMHPPIRDGHLYALLVAQDARAAQRTALSYVSAFFDSSAVLRKMVSARQADTIELTNGIRIGCYPCRPAAVRGLRAIIAVCDELAFFRSTENAPQDLEMLRALRPCLATTHGRLIILSSPYGQSGALWDLHRKHFGRLDSPVFVWQADAMTMHPDLPTDYLERMREDDPEAYRSEVLGEFRQGLSSLLDPAVIDDATAHDRLELPPSGALDYVAFTDPSGGRKDAWTLCIAHREEERAVVDVLRAWISPFNPSGVAAEVADLLKTYRVERVTGDRYGGLWPREALMAHGIEYEPAERDKSALYMELLAAMNSHRVEVPDDPLLARELRGLERKRGPSGRDRVDHAPGACDDRANAVAGVASMLLGKASGPTWADLYGEGVELPGETEELRGWARVMAGKAL